MPRKPREQLFWAKADRRPGDECWPWTGYCDPDSYGRFWMGGYWVLAHRYAYTVSVGEIPKGMQIDHICHRPEECAGGGNCPHRRCVRPDHMRVVTLAENCSPERRNHQNSRKTHCKWGHALSGDNVYTGSGIRQCRTCSRAVHRARYQRLKEAS